MARQKEETRVTAEECDQIRDFYVFVFIDAESPSLLMSTTLKSHFFGKYEVGLTSNVSTLSDFNDYMMNIWYFYGNVN